MIKKIVLASAVSMSLASISAMANEAKTGAVFGLYGGYAKPLNGMLKDIKNEAGGGIGNYAAGALWGYDFAIDPMMSIGFEVDGQYYRDIAESQMASTDLTAGILFLTGKFYIPETGGLNLFAKGGYAYNMLKVKDIDEDLLRPVAAAGFGYQMGDVNIFVQGQYNWLPYAGKDGSYGAAFAGISFAFPA